MTIPMALLVPLEGLLSVSRIGQETFFIDQPNEGVVNCQTPISGACSADSEKVISYHLFVMWMH
jgi:hypothetical protein